MNPFESLPKKLKLKQVRIVQSRPMAQGQWSLWVRAENEEPLDFFQPGQFSMLSIPDLIDPVLPRPFAIVERNELGDYHFIYKVYGKLTKLLAQMSSGIRLQLLGPLGTGFSASFLESHPAAFIVGGVGYASVMPLIQASPSADAQSTLFYGVRTDKEIIRKGHLKSTFIASDDGSFGFHGRLPDLLKKEESSWKDKEAIYVCGPSSMMRALYRLLPPEKTYYFLEEAMGCGVGLCVGCVVPVAGADGSRKYIRSCMEGPIFPGHRLNLWSEL